MPKKGINKLPKILICRKLKMSILQPYMTRTVSLKSLIKVFSIEDEPIFTRGLVNGFIFYSDKIRIVGTSCRMEI